MPIDVIVFDFDGVILDSAGVKTNAFGEVFKEHGHEAVEYVLKYHQAHCGVSRYVKFRHFYDKLLGREITPQEMADLDRRFDEFALEQLANSPLVPGVREFLEYGFQRWPLYIASGAPQRELDYLLGLMNIAGYFKEVHGSPPHKSESLAEIIRREQADPKRVLMVGDSSTDLQAAEDNNALFLGVGKFQDRPWIADLTTMREAIEREFGT